LKHDVPTEPLGPQAVVRGGGSIRRLAPTKGLLEVLYPFLTPAQRRAGRAAVLAFGLEIVVLALCGTFGWFPRTFPPLVPALPTVPDSTLAVMIAVALLAPWLVKPIGVALIPAARRRPGEAWKDAGARTRSLHHALDWFIIALMWCGPLGVVVALQSG
jgi:hypothetical protein